MRSATQVILHDQEHPVARHAARARRRLTTRFTSVQALVAVEKRIVVGGYPR